MPHTSTVEGQGVRLSIVNGQPVAVVTSYLPARILAGIDKHDLQKQIFESTCEHVLTDNSGSAAPTRGLGGDQSLYAVYAIHLLARMRALSRSCTELAIKYQ